MSASQRNKGARAERSLCKLLADELGIDVRRNIDQARAGGADCLMVPGFAIECKHVEVLRRNSWWQQAVRQAAKAGAEPMVFFKQNRKPWRALVVADGGYRDVAWDEALDAIRDKLTRLYGIYKEAA